VQQFLWDIVYVGAASFAAAVLVLLFQARLRVLAATRRRRVVSSGVLLGVQAMIALLVASVDFGEARREGAFNPADLTAMRWLVPLAAIAVALELFISLHSDFAEEARGALERQLDFARRERNFATLVLEYFLNVVSRKRERLKLATSKSVLLDPQSPPEQMTALIQACWQVLDRQRTRAETAYRLRVAYFRRTAVGLELALAWNGTSIDCVPKRDAKTRARFRFDHPEGCLAVAAARDGTMYRIPDTSADYAERASAFVFFDQNEVKTLKSIAALPIKIEGDSMAHGVLVVDTDEKGFFNPEDRRQELELGLLVENLAHRLQLEERLQSLLGGKGV
jgi:hypothetical protein